VAGTRRTETAAAGRGRRAITRRPAEAKPRPTTCAALGCGRGSRFRRLPCAVARSARRARAAVQRALGPTLARLAHERAGRAHEPQHRATRPGFCYASAAAEISTPASSCADLAVGTPRMPRSNAFSVLRKRPARTRRTQTELAGRGCGPRSPPDWPGCSAVGSYAATSGDAAGLLMRVRCSGIPTPASSSARSRDGTPRLADVQRALGARKRVAAGTRPTETRDRRPRLRRPARRSIASPFPRVDRAIGPRGGP